MQQDHRPLFGGECSDLGSVAQVAELLALLSSLVLVLLLFAQFQLTAGLVEDLVQGGFLLGLDLFFEVLLAFSLLFLASDDLCGLVDFLILARSTVRQLHQALSVAFLSFGLDVVPDHGHRPRDR